MTKDSTLFEVYKTKLYKNNVYVNVVKPLYLHYIFLEIYQ